mmetsp:Transcript_33581/g.73290  ORF Transcript_33581/g.73290 Transcript_33581/m.73290 type:complete len:470 (-) Transcript_33581:88-1497(-)|eukprot:CAMPEP_0118927932 /NCGR_PEP_ID=MMETSP1169-20130426/5304_1 /TAXON_ID=36882 /ORGANISM="Pyramimonas obovata, Strain CCMP722" /LENGTH=469 /DNA_ID=CAMNT_0006869807 /DNA_START=238 /DNA_END=1647 /DNA_ORIENTATION=+
MASAKRPTPVPPYVGPKPQVKWVQDLTQTLKEASNAPPADFAKYLPFSVASRLLDDANKLLKWGPTGYTTVADVAKQTGTSGKQLPPCMRNRAQAGSPNVIVVGDIHGHFHDFLHLLKLAGNPSMQCHYIFNGDFVDRGAWGAEVLFTMLAWKLALPNCVNMIRGNHESEYCTSAYGFKNELLTKYGQFQGSRLFSRCLTVFAALPLAAVVDNSVLVLHGGLFRRPTKRKSRRPATASAASTKRPTSLYNPPSTLTPTDSESPTRPRLRASSARGERSGSTLEDMNHPSLKFMEGFQTGLEVGTLDDLRECTSGGLDPDGQGSSLVPSDVMWSDPMHTNGFRENTERGIGLVFGPNVTQQFLEQNNLQLVVRSHEGPDARSKRPDMKDITGGYTEDHVVPAGKLVTLFSAPDYPMFAAGEDRTCNQAAFLRLKPPAYAKDPEVVRFEAVTRPKASAFYHEDSEEEVEEV